ncbi:MAG: NAD(+) synthase [Butyrivibrio sp.]|nr:NAD(+) synthase [Butyrivibrio sp.]
MKDGFIKVAAATPKIKVADPFYNAERVIEQIDEATKKGAKIIVFPELVLTGYTCNDLFLQDRLLDATMQALQKLVEHSKDSDVISFVGLPVEHNGKLYNCAAAIQSGQIIAMIPKCYMPNYGEFYEQRYFASGLDFKTPTTIKLPGMHFFYDEDFEDDDDDAEELFEDDNYEFVEFGKVIIDLSPSIKGLKVACEICEDLWVPNPPSTGYAMNGATLIVNLSASNDIVGKDSYRRELVKSTSGRLVAGYVYASAGEGESTQDIVFGGHNIIAENGTILAEQTLFENGITYADIDIQRICHERRKMNTFTVEGSEPDAYSYEDAEIKVTDTKLSRTFPARPFVPSNPLEREKRCEQILSIQAMGLKKRLEHTGCKTAVIGVSGGLDSTLALLVTVRAFDYLKLDRKGIIAVTMPCFGTTDRTYQNACNLAKSLGATLKEVDIKASVTQHFKDIGQDINTHDVTYENGQARERTQVLMDIANKMNGMVIGTGDLSELALGWATYNGDHMSMYGVNVGVPKTLVRHLVKYYADECCDDKTAKKGDKKVREILLDVLDTPVSPELLPPTDGQISQETESIVGPYELHDFFLYYMLRWGFSKEKIRRIAYLTFADKKAAGEASAKAAGKTGAKASSADAEDVSYYDKKTIDKWLDTFCRRFFSQQFKRSCLPDGPKVGSVAVSPRGDLRMPSDASAALWM